MSPLPFLLLLLFLLFVRGRSREEATDFFFTSCRPSSCARDCPAIRFPLRLDSASPRCGLPSLPPLSCSSAGSPLLSLPSLPSSPLPVVAVDYATATLTLDASAWAPCPLLPLSTLNLSASPFTISPNSTLSLLNCPSSAAADSAGPITCLNRGPNRTVYAVDSGVAMDMIPSDCVAVGTVDIPLYTSDGGGGGTAGENVKEFTRRLEISLQWEYSEVRESCRQCETKKRLCGLSWARNETICSISDSNHGSHIIRLIVGISIGLLLVLTLAALYILYIYRRSDKEKETRLKVEHFLANYTATKPTRYSYTEIKRITRRFTQQLGQGGFGNVYKGELSNGVPVAIKMLQNSKGGGEEFINEVATIGRIHHINIVRLLGFCSEGTRRALVYELMPNGSLEKFIFPEEAEGTYRPFSMEKLQEITIGIAQGIEYLHQGCNQRILHFDIKPHNILLDYDFNPKISDFGLAKLCSRDQSIVTMTAARGTMGYIAPEMYSRNFGTVSYKSDVYSFGMLVLEMVGGRKNIDPQIGNENEVYFPEWFYDLLVKGYDLQLALNIDCNEEIVRRLAIVGLWCIQCNPMNRPSMSRVVQMLTGDLQSLEIPPKPFVSSIQENSI